MEQPLGTLFVSIPSLLDPSLAPAGTHIFHAFAPDWIDGYQVGILACRVSCRDSFLCPQRQEPAVCADLCSISRLCLSLCGPACTHSC